MQTLVESLRRKLLISIAASKPQRKFAVTYGKMATTLECEESEVERVVGSLVNKALQVKSLSGQRFEVAWADGRDEREAQCQQVFEHWRALRSHPERLKLTPQRKRLILARLGEKYTVQQLCLACDQLMESTHHIRGGYLDVAYFAGTSERVDEWLAKFEVENEDTELQRIEQQMNMRLGR